MGMDLAFEVNVVDPGRDFVNTLEAALQEEFRGYSVVGYPSTEQFVRQVEAAPLRVPLVVVADRAARTPSVEEGVFSAARRIVPRCRNILYSASMGGLERMTELGLVERAVCRSASCPERRLIESVRSVLVNFENSIDSLLIRRFFRAVRSAPHPEMSTVDGEDGALSPLRMLIEMARGTELGCRYLRDMHPINIE